MKIKEIEKIHEYLDLGTELKKKWNMRVRLIPVVVGAHRTIPNELDDPIYLFTNPSARGGYDTRSVFKRSLTGFNSEFFFS